MAFMALARMYRPAATAMRHYALALVAIGNAPAPSLATAPAAQPPVAVRIECRNITDTMTVDGAQAAERGVRQRQVVAEHAGEPHQRVAFDRRGLFVVDGIAKTGKPVVTGENYLPPPRPQKRLESRKP